MILVPFLRLFASVVAIGAGLIYSAIQSANTMGIQASSVDTRRYFSDARVAEFVRHVQQGDLAQVQAGLRAGISPNAQGRDGFTPIFFIFPARNADVARALLRAGADPNAKLPDGTPVLQFAVRLENPEFTKALLEFKADPNAIGQYEQPVIHEAVLAGEARQLELLVRAGADINVIWGMGTPLFAAIGAVNFAAAAKLLDLGANSDWRSPGGKSQPTAGELLCSFMDRMQPTPTNRKPVLDLFAAFARRGVKLSCVAEAERFR